MGGTPRKKPGKRGQAKGRDALRHENNQFAAVANKLRLDHEQRRELHDEIHGQDLSYNELLELATDLFGQAEGDEG